MALGKGSYAGTLPLKAGVRVLGACTRDTILTGAATVVQSVVSVTTAVEPESAENLTVRGAPQLAALVRGGRRLSLRGVLIDQARGIGVIGEGAVWRTTAPVVSSPSERARWQRWPTPSSGIPRPTALA